MNTIQDTKPLPVGDIKKRLESVSGWSYRDDKLHKTFEFGSFTDVINFLLKLTPYFNSVDHHPDICIYYKKLQLTLQRFDVGGKVTARDFMVAQKIDEEFASSRQG